MRLNNILAVLLALSLSVFVYGLTSLSVIAGFTVAIVELFILMQSATDFVRYQRQELLVAMLARIVFMPLVLFVSYKNYWAALFALSAVILLEIAYLTGFKFSADTQK